MSSYQKYKGNMGEDAVVDFLQQKGCMILERNYFIQGGEIDIIAVDNNKIRFIEVKTRKQSGISSGFESVNNRKQKNIIRTALKYCFCHVVDLQPCFDVALVCMENGCVQSIDYLENAFDLSDFDSLF